MAVAVAAPLALRTACAALLPLLLLLLLPQPLLAAGTPGAAQAVTTSPGASAPSPLPSVRALPVLLPLAAAPAPPLTTGEVRNDRRLQLSPSPTPTNTPSPTPTPSPTVSLSVTPSSTPTETLSVTPSSTLTLSGTPSPTPSQTVTPSNTPSGAPTPSQSPSVTYNGGTSASTSDGKTPTLYFDIDISASTPVLTAAFLQSFVPSSEAPLASALGIPQVIGGRVVITAQGAAVTYSVPLGSPTEAFVRALAKTLSSPSSMASTLAMLSSMLSTASGVSASAFAVSVPASSVKLLNAAFTLGPPPPPEAGVSLTLIIGAVVSGAIAVAVLAACVWYLASLFCTPATTARMRHAHAKALVYLHQWTVRDFRTEGTTMTPAERLESLKGQYDKMLADTRNSLVRQDLVLVPAEVRTILLKGDADVLKRQASRANLAAKPQHGTGLLGACSRKFEECFRLRAAITEAGAPGDPVVAVTTNPMRTASDGKPGAAPSFASADAPPAAETVLPAFENAMRFPWWASTGSFCNRYLQRCDCTTQSRIRKYNKATGVHELVIKGETEVDNRRVSDFKDLGAGVTAFLKFEKYLSVVFFILLLLMLPETFMQVPVARPARRSEAPPTHTALINRKPYTPTLSRAQQRPGRPEPGGRGHVPLIVVGRHARGESRVSSSAPGGAPPPAPAASPDPAPDLAQSPRPAPCRGSWPRRARAPHPSSSAGWSASSHQPHMRSHPNPHPPPTLAPPAHRSSTAHLSS